MHLVGLSLGGAVGQWLGAHHPQRVQTLTAAVHGRAVRAGRSRGSIARPPSAPTASESIAESVVGRWFTPGLASVIRNSSGTPRRDGRVDVRRGIRRVLRRLSRWDGRADLSRIAAPTLVIAGEEDRPLRRPRLRTIADGIAGAQFHVLSPGAHLANVEQAGAVTALLREHIAGGDPGTRVARRAVARTRNVGAPLGSRRRARGPLRRREPPTSPAPFQDFITRTAWGDIWSRPGLDHESRRLLTLAILTAVGNEHELDMHIRAALRAGIDADTSAKYSSTPPSTRVCRTATRVRAR